MIEVKELRRWLSTFTDDALVGVDDGGLTLRVESADTGLCSMCEPWHACYKHEAYLEVGGIPESDDDA